MANDFNRSRHIRHLAVAVMKMTVAKPKLVPVNAGPSPIMVTGENDDLERRRQAREKVFRVSSRTRRVKGVAKPDHALRSIMLDETGKPSTHLMVAPKRQEISDLAMGIGVTPVNIRNDKRTFALEVKRTLGRETPAGANFSLEQIRLRGRNHRG